MKAAVLETAGLKKDAKKYYQKALSKNPNDQIAKQMYKAFSMNHE